MKRNKIYNIGIEREGLRCDKQGKLSKLNFNEIFGDEISRDFITTDFGEAQLELRTPVCSTPKECYEKLETITDVALCEMNLKDELLWPYSMPCILPEEKDFPFGNYKDGTIRKYKEYLSKKYHYTKRAISGVHVSFSFKDEGYKYLRENYKELNLPEDVDEAYIRIMKNYVKRGWMLTYLLSASPISCDINEEQSVSIRNSVHGFKNLIPIELNFENKKEHFNSIRKYIENKHLYSLAELYDAIRAKAYNGSDDINKLEEGISHIEVRICDINPFDKCGVSKEQLELIIAFLFYCLIEKECPTYDYREISFNGLSEKQYQELVNELEYIIKINETLNLGLENGINEIYNMLKNNILGFSKVRNLVKEKEYLNTFIDLAKKYSEEAEKSRYMIKAYPKLEDSTIVVMKDAVLSGVDVNVLDEEKCILELIKGDKKEITVQATRTSKDNSTLQYIANDKVVAKKLMSDNGLIVPEGIDFKTNISEKELELIANEYSNMPIVVKPKSTNFGTGITIFEAGTEAERIKKAVEFASQFDNTVLIEKFAKGKEYRFLVIDHKCIAVTWRRNASVVGDGKSTIAELIERKNNELWHKAVGSYIKNDNGLKEYFDKHNITMNDIPENGKRVTLRGNSNVSTGGENLDMTDIMPEYFKRISEKVSESLGASICGVDIIINDMNKEEYTVLEANSNPGIDLHRWPYEGKEIRVGHAVLKLLDLAD